MEADGAEPLSRIRIYYDFMSTSSSGGRWIGRVAAIAAVVLVAIVVALVTRAVVANGSATASDASAADSTPAATAPPAFVLADTMFGRSGMLRFRTLSAAHALELPGFLETFGEGAIHDPAVHSIRATSASSASARDAGGGDGFSLIVLRPFGEKQGEMLGSYRLGLWPSERWMMARNYWNPSGFVEVTPEQVELPLSTHFRLGEFLTHAQGDIWPKYVVLEEVLIDKLELVLADLAANGVAVDHVRVLSGFRAPYYNDRLSGEGAARASRHQYGDAADVVIDADGNGSMDDVNGDGRVDLNDARAILRAVERVEQRYPELVGGTGVYAAMGPSGPFVHVDVRGTSARW